MGDEIRYFALRDCGKWYSGGTPSKARSDLWQGDIPWISAKSLHDFFVRDSELRVSESAIGRGTRLVTENTVLFVVRGMSLKSEFRMGITTRPVAFNQDLKALEPYEWLLPHFIAYALKAREREILALVEEAGHGTGVLPTNVVGSLKIWVPELEEQSRIVNLCKTLDDKIELNRKMNATLESLAQALFKSWFVDFEPVIDKALAAGNPIPERLQKRAEARKALGDQRKPLPADIEALFPDSFELNETLGWVPVGWEVAPVSELVEINPRLSLRKGSVAKHVDMKALPTSGFSIGRSVMKAYSGGSKFQQKDVLLARITPCLENGKTGVVDFLEDAEVGFGSTEFIVLRAVGRTGTAFVAALARFEGFRQHCINHMVGSSGRQRVQKSAFDSYRLAVPYQAPINNLFEAIGTSLLTSIFQANKESVSLAALRDTLLPKLLSGELRVPEAEKLVEEAL